MSLLIVGSIGMDDVKTAQESHANLLGGSASYAAVAASYFAPVRLVGVVGEDFPSEHRELLARRGINLDGLKVEKGRTFRWAGEYFADMNQRRTLSIQLNVFEKFMPELPASYRDTPFVLLGNIAPALQSHVLSQMSRPKFVMADTMDLWIETTRDDLLALLGKVDAVCMNDSEARQLTGLSNLIRAGRRLLEWGPRYAIIKKGEHGSILFGQEGFFSAPAFPLEELRDPTGAGDVFAGALMGCVAHEGTVDFEALRRAVVCGSVMASFNVESFSLGRLQDLEGREIEERLKAFQRISAFEAPRMQKARRAAAPPRG